MWELREEGISSLHGRIEIGEAKERDSTKAGCRIHLSNLSCEIQGSSMR